MYAYFKFLFLPNDNSYSQKNTVTEPILISISQDVSIISVTEITDEVNRCYQPIKLMKHMKRLGNKL